MASIQDLTTLADLKSWLGITSTGDDLLLGALITDISVAILTDLGRATIIPSVYTETRDGEGEMSITLRNWPVSQILSFMIDGASVSIMNPPVLQGAEVLSAVLDGADPAPAGGLQRLSIRYGSLPHGIQNVSIVYRAGYEIAAETATVPITAPFIVNALAPYGAWQTDGGVSYVSGGALQAANTLAIGTYSVATGAYAFSSADAGANVTLRYGYVPADLSRCCKEWAAERYAYRSRIGQSSKALGGQETAAFIVKDMPDFVSRLMQPYRRVVRP